MRIQTDLDGVHISLPRRMSGRVQDHRRLQVAAIAAALVAAGSGLLAVPAAQAGASLGIVASAIFLAGLLPYGVLLVGQQQLRIAHRISLTGARLCIDGRQLSLEEITAVQVVRQQVRGWLVLTTPQGPVAVLDGLRVGELRWLAALITEHASRRRAAVGEGAAAVPPALTTLVAKAALRPEG